MPKPRADFECSPCQKIAGTPEPVVHENLPVSSVFCPYSGKRRGFRRLFDKVQVSTTGHRVARFIDKRLGPQMDKHRAVKSGSNAFATDHAQAMDKAYELAKPEEREQIVHAPKLGHGITAAAAYSSIDPAARRDSVSYTWPMVKRQVVPLFERGRA